MTQTGGLVILLAWTIFGGLLAVLAFLLLRHKKDPLQDLAASTSERPTSPGGTSEHHSAAAGGLAVGDDEPDSSVPTCDEPEA